MPFVVFIGHIARVCLHHKGSRDTDTFIDRVLWVCGLVSVMWIIIDRPGMGSLGASTGGAWEAAMGLSAIAAYWGIRSLREVQFNWKHITIFIVCVTITISVWMMIKQISYGMISGIFRESGWWLYGLLLGIIIKVSKRKTILWNLSLYAVCIVLLSNALISGYRSRILFGPLMLGAAFWTGGMRKQMIVALCIFTVVILCMANSAIYQDAPLRAQRVLSVVRLDQRATPHKIYGLGEMGPRSPWRMRVWCIAVKQIRKKPLLGHGYGFDSVTLLADVGSAPTVHELITRGVSTVGQFHNIALNLMYFWGIPIGLAFCMAWAWAFWRLISLASMAEGWFGAFLVGVSVYSVAASGQALMNGGGGEYVLLCTVMGILQAVAPKALSRMDAGSTCSEDEHGYPQSDDTVPKDNLVG